MYTLITVTVTYDSTLNTLSIDPPELPIQNGNGVYWKFDQIPAGCVPQILFETAFGPFHSLRLRSDGNILGRGKTDIPTTETYFYKALLLDSVGARAVSDEASIINAPQPGNSSPDVVIEYSEIGGGLTVEPNNLYLFRGDTAVWHIRHLPTGYFVDIVFYEYSDPWIGPFGSFTLDRTVTGENPEQFFIVGTDFQSPLNQTSYRIEVRDQVGAIVASHDPKIDNIGDPPTGVA